MQGKQALCAEAALCLGLTSLQRECYNVSRRILLFFNAETEVDVFRPGDRICYPMHGVGVVEAIEERSVLGKEAQYYVLRFVAGKMTALVPVDTADQVGLRAIIPTKECDCVIKYLKETPCPESDNWNQRYRDNYAKLRGGNIYDVADVVKCLKKRDSGKGLSAGERKMLLTAQQVLLAELSTASGRDEDELSDIMEVGAV